MPKWLSPRWRRTVGHRTDRCRRRRLRRHAVGNGVTMDFLDLPSGTYNGVVTTEGELACGVQTFEASVISPTTIDMAFDVQHDCGEGGEVTVSSEGGAMP